MKLHDKETQSIAATVSDVLEGKVKKEEVKYPHKMYHPENGKEVEVKDKAEHEEYAKKGYVHEKPEVNEVEEPRAQGEKEFKNKHVVKKVGVKTDLDGTVYNKEEKEAEEEVEEAMTKKQYKAQKSKSQNKSFGNVRKRLENAEEESVEQQADEESEKQAKYRKFFDKALKKFGVESPAELDKEKKKEFFDYVDKNYEADKESD